MVADAEMIADRRRLRRKLTVWRAATIAALILAVVGIGFAASGRRGPLGALTPQIARISVSGIITGDRRMAELFRRVGESPAVSGVVISIGSPGGTTTGSEELFRGIRALAEKKPTVAFVDSLAASGGYITALATDRIVARDTSLVGSIGVLFQYPEFYKLLGNIGVTVDAVKSSPLKAEPSGFGPTPPAARAALQSVVDDTYAWFKDLVQSRRHMTADELAAVSDGRIFSARQGLPLKLVDQLGTERDAVAWLERDRNVSPNLPIRDWKPKGSSAWSFWTSAAAGADLAGWSEVATTIRSLAGSAAATRLDGILALWQPSSGER